MIALHSEDAGRVRVRTTVGVRIGWHLSPKRAVRCRLERGPYLAAFDAGVYEEP